MPKLIYLGFQQTEGSIDTMAIGLTIDAMSNERLVRTDIALLLHLDSTG